MGEWPCEQPTPGGMCGVLTAQRYGTGPRCPDHTPARLAGRPESVPDPSRGAAALMVRTDVAWATVPYGTATTDPLGRTVRGTSKNGMIPKHPD